MARHQWLTPRQKGIVRRYYEHKETLGTQKLSEIVSELYLCEDAGKAERLWQQALTALKNAGVHEARAKRIVEGRNLERLAHVLEEVF
ncbi:MAG: hypothetical protein GXY85_11110 [Candidatus Brocadiaceae bacterium]|nr:hypothetical protein [Candidatus Brocadiaceae bacterium]